MHYRRVCPIARQSSIEGPSDSRSLGQAIGVKPWQLGDCCRKQNIARFCEDLTAKAAAGRIDPVFGRDNEIRQMIDILARRRKKQPHCGWGAAGWGKSAVVEGLALLMSQNEVPDLWQNTRLLSLDLGALEAGASVKASLRIACAG